MFIWMNLLELVSLYKLNIVKRRVVYYQVKETFCQQNMQIEILVTIICAYKHYKQLIILLIFMLNDNDIDKNATNNTIVTT